MFNSQKDQLFTLVKSLNKSEKRNFKLYANRFQSGTDTKFIQLFDAMDKLQEYDEEALLKKLKSVKKRHLPNLKRHLYKQVMVSLRLIYIQKNIDIQIREQLDFARILYGKGLYMQSLKILERIKKIALEHHQDILHLEILEFRKLIEARHITRNWKIKNEIEGLMEESDKRSIVTISTSKLSNLNIIIHGYYIRFGHVKSAGDIIRVQQFYTSKTPSDLPWSKLTFFEKSNLYQSNMWFFYILLDFESCIEQTRQWINLFEVDDKMKEKDPDLYMRGYYYLLTFLFLLQDKQEFQYYLNRFENFVTHFGEQFNANSKMTAFTYLNLCKLNGWLLERQFEKGKKLAIELVDAIPHFQTNMDPQRFLLFNYKASYFHFACGDFEKAIEYLHPITTLKNDYLREDLLYNARLLQLLCHFELNDFELVTNLIPNLHRHFKRSSEVSKLQICTLNLLKELSKTPPSGLKQILSQYLLQMEQLKTDPFEKKATIYLNVPDWINSKLKQTLIKDLTPENQNLKIVRSSLSEFKKVRAGNLKN